jgi:hypothetical protein
LSHHNKKEVIAMTHIWLGRILVTLGMVNGGLGLLLGGDSTRGEKIAYGVISGFIWVTWIFIVITIPIKRGETIPGTIDREKKVSHEGARTAINNSFSEADTR